MTRRARWSRVRASARCCGLRLELPPGMVDALFGVWWHMALALGLAAASCTGLATIVLAFVTYPARVTSGAGFL